MQPRDKAAILAVNTIEFTFSSQRREMLHQHGAVKSRANRQ